MDKIRVLAVDDEAGVLKVITDTFTGYNITTETSSIKAMELIHNEQFDIFIVDFQMPEIDGIEVLEEVQRLYTGKEYVSILCTAYGTVHLFKKELVKGIFTFYLEKPFDIEAIKLVMLKAETTLIKMKTGEKQKVIQG